MANSNPALIKFTNEDLRPYSDQFCRFHTLTKQVGFLALSKSIAAMIDDPTAPVADGAGADGRTPIVGQDVLDALAQMDAIVAENEANANKLIALFGKIAVNPIG